MPRNYNKYKHQTDRKMETIRMQDQFAMDEEEEDRVAHQQQFSRKDVQRQMSQQRLQQPPNRPPQQHSQHELYAEDLEMQIAMKKTRKRDRQSTTTTRIRFQELYIYKFMPFTVSHPPSPRIMSPMGFAVHRQTRYHYDDDDDYEEWESDLPSSRVRPVPIWLCVFLVVSYIIAGAFLFSRWEGWSFLDSAYFCFITLTTIGANEKWVFVSFFNEINS